MEPLQAQTEDHIEINQTRQRFVDLVSPGEQLLCNILIYCSCYYPRTKGLLRDVLNNVWINDPLRLLAAIDHLYECFLRQVIYGPSSAHVPPSDLPAMKHKDIGLIINTSNTQQNVQQFQEYLQKFDLLGIIPLERCEELVWYRCSMLLSMDSIHKCRNNYSEYKSELELEGENWLQTTPLPSLLCTLKQSCKILLDSEQIQYKNKGQQSELQTEYYYFKIHLLLSRLCFLQNKLLKNPIGHLSDQTIGHYRQCLKHFAKQETDLHGYCEILLEYAYALLFYYKYTQAQKTIAYCCDALKIQIEFTGRLGRRTKYQSFDTPQLVMNLTNKKSESSKQMDVEQEDSPFELIDAKKLVWHQASQQEHHSFSSQIPQIQKSVFDEQSILLQLPKFSQQPKITTNNLTSVTNIQALSILCAIHYGWRTTPHDEMFYQSTNATTTTLFLVDSHFTYPIQFSLLFLRSLNEFPRIKHAERALDQLQRLKTYYNTKSDKNMQHLHPTPYETYLSYIIVLAAKYMEMGLSISAVQLYQRAGLFEECIDALILRNYKEKALELALRLRKEKGDTPRLLCMLGDIQSEGIQYYEESWSLSKSTYARAQRSLGWVYFSKQDYQKAAVSFTLSTQVSRYHPSTWFTLGCCHMKLNEYQKALKAFSECICIDETQGEAWGNMASCYLQDKKYKEAYATLEQAVKHSESNWKLWANLLSVSLTLKQFYKYFECFQRLVDLRRSDILTEEMYAKIVQVMKYKNQTELRKRAVYNCKHRIERLFRHLQENIGGQPIVWKTKANFCIELLNYNSAMLSHYQQLHKEGKIDHNDLVPEYETLEKTLTTTANSNESLRILIVESKQTELNMCMSVGWDANKLQCRKVQATMHQYINIYREYSARTDFQQFKIFVNGIRQKMQACLEEKIVVKIDF